MCSLAFPVACTFGLLSDIMDLGRLFASVTETETTLVGRCEDSVTSPCFLLSIHQLCDAIADFLGGHHLQQLVGGDMEDLSPVLRCGLDVTADSVVRVSRHVGRSATIMVIVGDTVLVAARAMAMWGTARLVKRSRDSLW